MRKILVVLAIIVAIGAWYAFRPERLFINQRVNEQFPTTAAASTKLATGVFHSGAHETKGTAAVFQLADGKKTLRLTDFATSNGPDVHVYLVAVDDDVTVERISASVDHLSIHISRRHRSPARHRSY